MVEWHKGLVLAQSPGGIGLEANRLSQAASENGISPIVVVVGIAVLIAMAVLLFKLRKE